MGVHTVRIVAGAIVLASSIDPTLLSAQRGTDAAADRNVSVRVEEVFRVGGADSPEWASFTDVRSLAFGPSGELWIPDGRAARILAVDRTGKLIRQVGRKGEGPGEFTVAALISVGRDGRVLVNDPINRTLQLFDSNGELLESVMTVPELSSPAGMALVGDREIASYARTFRGSRGYLISGTMEPVTDGIPVLRFNLAAQPKVTKIAMARFRAPPPPKEPLTPHAFQARVLWSAAPDGRVALVDTVAYEIRFFDVSGQPGAHLTRALQPREPSRTDVQRAREEFRKQLIRPDGQSRVATVNAAGGNPPDRNELTKRTQAAIDAMTHEPLVPVLKEIRFDATGRLWVARNAAVWGDSSPIDLFDPSGSYLGTITRGIDRLPDAFGPDNLAAWIERDSLDVPVVVVRRITVS
jgi:hypothetical protein